MSNPWDFVPSDVYEDSNRAEQSEQWLVDQRRKLSQQWFDGWMRQAEDAMRPFQEALGGLGGMIGGAGEAYQEFADLDPTEQRARVVQRLVGDPLGRVGEAVLDIPAVESERALGDIMQWSADRGMMTDVAPGTNLRESPDSPVYGAPREGETLLTGAGWEDVVKRHRGLQETNPELVEAGLVSSPINFAGEVLGAAKGAVGGAGLAFGGLKKVGKVVKGAERAAEATRPTTRASEALSEIDARIAASSDPIEISVLREQRSKITGEAIPPEPPLPPAPPAEKAAEAVPENLPRIGELGNPIGGEGGLTSYDKVAVNGGWVQLGGDVVVRPANLRARVVDISQVPSGQLSTRIEWLEGPGKGRVGAVEAKYLHLPESSPLPVAAEAIPPEPPRPPAQPKQPRPPAPVSPGRSKNPKIAAIQDKLLEIGQRTWMKTEEFDLVVNQRDPSAISRRKAIEAAAEREANSVVRDLTDDELVEALTSEQRGRFYDTGEPAPTHGNGAPDYVAREIIRRRDQTGAVTRAAEGVPPEPPRPPAPPEQPPTGSSPNLPAVRLPQGLVGANLPPTGPTTPPPMPPAVMPPGGGGMPPVPPRGAPPGGGVPPGGVPPAGLGLPPPGGTVPPGRGAQVNTILSQMYAKQPRTIGLPNLPKAVDGFIVRWVNRNMPLERIEELATQVKAITNDTLLADEMAAELRLVNSSGVAERRLAQQFSPILQEVDARGELPNLRNYLTFRQNIDAANALGNPNRMASGGITPTDSYAGLQHLEQTLGPQAYAQLERDAGKVQDFVRSIWDRKLEGGLITPELHDMLATRYPYFVPTRILDYMKEADSTVATGGRLTINSNMVKKYTTAGTAKAREDPLESIRKYEIETEALAAKNEAFNAFLRLRDIIPGADQIFKAMPNGYKATRDEIVVHGYVNGVKQTISVPIDLQRALDWESHAPIPFIATAVNVFKALATSRNPAFLAANALNDFRSYVTRATMREGGPYPQNVGRVIGALIDAYRDAFTGLGTTRYGPKTEHMLSTGAGQGGFFQGSDKALDDLIRPHALTVRNKGDLLRILMDVVTLKPVEALGKRVELAPRVAQHQLAEARGMEWPAAMKQARSVTMDFQVGGDLGMLFNQFIPFFNVGIQAPAQVVRAFRENRRAFVATGAALIAGPALAAEAWNRSDPQRAKDYDDKPDYVKDMGTLIMLPRSVFPPSVDKEGNPHPQAVFVPGREWQVIANITREAAGRALGADPRSWADLFGGSMKTLAPVQGSNVGEIAAGLTVPGLSTAAQVGFFNRDPFTGNMIATKRNDERAAALSKAVAGAIGARPSQVEYTIRDLTSGVGGMVLGASELATGTPSPNAGAPQAAPVVGGMVSRFLKGNIGQKLETAQQNIVTGETRAILREAGITSDPGPVGRTIDDVPLTIAEQTEYQQLFNREFNKALAPLAKSVSWKKARPEDKQGYIEYLSNRIRSDIRGYIKYKGGEAFLRRGYAVATGQAAGR